MPHDSCWRIIYRDGAQSRVFATADQAVSHLASQRDPMPDIDCIRGPERKVLSREIVWLRIEALNDAG